MSNSQDKKTFLTEHPYLAWGLLGLSLILAAVLSNKDYSLAAVIAGLFIMAVSAFSWMGEDLGKPDRLAALEAEFGRHKKELSTLNDYVYAQPNVAPQSSSTPAPAENQLDLKFGKLPDHPGVVQYSVCVWPNGDWCFAGDIEEKMTSSWAKSDDYEVVNIPVPVECNDLEGFIENCLQGSGYGRVF